VTHNRRDFEQLHQHLLASGQTHRGIIIASVHDVYALAERLVKLLNTLSADEIANQLLYI